MPLDNSQAAGSAPDPSVGNTDPGSTQKKGDTVSYDSFDKLVGQLKKSKENVDMLTKQVTDFESEKKRIEEGKLAEQGEFKKLLEMRETEIGTLRESLNLEKDKSNVASKTLVDAQKLQAVYEELPGRIKNSKYMQFIDLEGVAYNPDTGQVDRESAKLSANKFAEDHVSLIDTSHIGKLPSDSSSTGQPISSTFKSLSLKEMRANLSTAVKQRKTELGIT